MCSRAFPEVKQVVPRSDADDGTDATGFFNTEYFVDLKPREQWRTHSQTKEELIAAMDEQLEKIPGVMWNFSQPIADNMEEAVSGVKGELAIKIFGADLKDLEHIGDEIIEYDEPDSRRAGPGDLSVIGQPNVNLIVNREKADRFGINVSDVQDAIETAVGGKAVSQILKGEARYDLVVRYQEPYRRDNRRYREHPDPVAFRRARFARTAVRYQSGGWRFADFSRRQLAVRRDQVQRSRARLGQHGARMP